MHFSKENIAAVVFDYGNTLIEFAAPQIRACDDALAQTLERLFGTVDADKLQAVRNRDRRAPYTGEYLENDLLSISKNVICELYGRAPSEEELAEVLRVRYESFVGAVSAPEYLHGFLDRLAGGYALGLLSNYPDGAAIRATLEKIDVARYFKAVVVSGDVGRVKPHGLPFRTILEDLGVEPAAALYVGDNWLGDIQGAKRAGMQAALIEQWDTPEKFDRRPGDLDADLTISHLTDLLDYL